MYNINTQLYIKKCIVHFLFFMLSFMWPTSLFTDIPSLRLCSAKSYLHFNLKTHTHTHTRTTIWTINFPINSCVSQFLGRGIYLKHPTVRASLDWWSGNLEIFARRSKKHSSTVLTGRYWANTGLCGDQNSTSVLSWSESNIQCVPVRMWLASVRYV